MYTKPLEYGGKHIGKIERTQHDPKGYPVFVNVQNTATFAKAQFDSIGRFQATHFHSSCNFDSARFNKRTTFYFARFDTTVFFNNVRFDTACYFFYTEFNSRAYFNKAVFKSKALFTYAKFKSESVFDDATFDTCRFLLTQFDTLYLHNVQFHSNADFVECIFHKGVYFHRTHFLSNCTFKESEFQDEGIFTNDTFGTLADFSGVKFFSNISYSYAHFRQKLDMENITVAGNTTFNFGGATLPDTIDLSYNPCIPMKGFIDFTLADSLEKHTGGNKIKINLYDADVSKIKIDYDHFQFYVHDNNRKDTGQLSKEIIYSVYEGMLKNFKERGQNNSYEELDIEYKDLRYGKRCMMHLWNAYGYHKEWIFRWIACLLVFFTIITMFFLPVLSAEKENNGIYYIDSIPTDLAITSARNFFRRLWYSLIYTSILFFVFSIKLERMNFKRGGIAYVVLVFSVGLICLGYLANFIVQK